MANETGLNQRIVAGTDGASFYLYHPDDLKHRETSPLGWSSYTFACRPEFEAGRLVAFDTGGDGGYGFRITDGPLTDREKKWLAGSWEFRYVVGHGRVYLDGGYALPSDDYFPDWDDNPDQWITIPNGQYKVTVSAIEWYSEPGALDENESATDDALASYVVQFEPVDDIADIPVKSPSPPRMETSRDFPPEGSHGFEEYDRFGEDEELEVADRYPLLVHEDEVPVPGFHVSREISNEFYEAVYGSVGSQMLPDRIETLVVAPSKGVPGLGVVVQPSGAGKSGDKPWSMSFFGLRLVEVQAVEPAETSWPNCRVVPFDRPSGDVSDEVRDRLKTAFAEYAKANEGYREAIRNPDFEAERVASLEKGASVVGVLIHHVRMPVEQRIALLRLSDADRADRLLTLMASE